MISESGFTVVNVDIGHWVQARDGSTDQPSNVSPTGSMQDTGHYHCGAI